MTVNKFATLLSAAIITSGLASGCSQSDNASTETNLADIPMPKIVNTKSQHGRQSRFQHTRPTSPRLLPNGMPG